MNIKVKRVLVRIGLVLLVIIVLALGVRAVFNFTTGKKLQAYLERSKSEGMVMSLKDLAPNCDDPDNAALLWKAAEALFLTPDTEGKTLIKQTIEGFFYGRPLQEESRAKLAPLIERNRKVLDLIVEAAGRPCFRYGDWKKRPYSIDPSNAVKMILAIRLLGINTVLRAEAGQVQTALDELRQGMRFIRRTIDEPILINNLVALANMKSLLNCFGQIVKGREMDPAILSAWIKELDPEAWRTKFWRCVETERALALETGLGVVKGDKDILRAEARGNRLYYWLIRPIQKLQIIWVQDMFKESNKMARVPYYQIKELTKEKQTMRESAPWYFKLSGLLLVDFQSVFLKEATLEAMMLTTQAGLACKIYKNETGHYPENLEALVPDFMDALPTDPFTGKPLIYRLQDSGVLIYSVGSNEKDDEGRGTYQITQLVMEKYDDDWAWKEK
jgi:hypothetical protein